MIEICISPAMIDLAKNRASLLGSLRNSITRGEGNIVGYLGELLIAEAYGSRCVREDTYDYDLLLDGRKVDVKTKLQTSLFPPRSYYQASVASYNLRQRCDEYWFCRVSKDLSVGWILGWIEKDKFLTEASQHKTGEIDRDNGFAFKADCLNIAYSQLNPTKSQQVNTKVDLRLKFF